MWSNFSRKITQGGVKPPSPYRRVMLCIYGVYLLYTTTVTSSFSSSTGVVVLVRTYRFCSGTSCFTSTMLWYMGTPHIPCTTNKYKYLSLPILVQLVPLVGFLPFGGYSTRRVTFKGRVSISAPCVTMWRNFSRKITQGGVEPPYPLPWGRVVFYGVLYSIYSAATLL